MQIRRESSPRVENPEFRQMDLFNNGLVGSDERENVATLQKVFPVAEEQRICQFVRKVNSLDKESTATELDDDLRRALIDNINTRLKIIEDQKIQWTNESIPLLSTRLMIGNIHGLSRSDFLASRSSVRRNLGKDWLKVSSDFGSAYLKTLRSLLLHLGPSSASKAKG